LYNFIVLSTDSDAILLERDGGGGGQERENGKNYRKVWGKEKS